MISNLAKLKKMHQEKPWLYEEEEHAVLKLAKDAVEFIEDTCEVCEHCKEEALKFLEEHK